MKFFRLILFPLSLLYGLGVVIRNAAFDLGLFRSTSFPIPIISIGNLAVGGSGKSPMAEFLIRMLKPRYRVAVLSRGYGRKTSGYRLVDVTSNSLEAGDEPVQFKRKFADITIAVSEDRKVGIEKLRNDHDVIILDDAFQHRWVKPGLSLLLFDYNSFKQPRMLLPAGDLREPWGGRARADIMVITKCPRHLDQSEKDQLVKAVKPLPGQLVFFATLDYRDLVPVFDESANNKLLSDIRSSKIILLTGIANAEPMYRELSKHSLGIDHHSYPDHHNFTTKNISKLAGAFHASDQSDTIIITTEKDVQRLTDPLLRELLDQLPVYYLPVEMRILSPDEGNFKEIIEKYATEPATYN